MPVLACGYFQCVHIIVNTFELNIRVCTTKNCKVQHLLLFRCERKRGKKRYKVFAQYLPDNLFLKITTITYQQSKSYDLLFAQSIYRMLLYDIFEEKTEYTT